MDHCRPRLGGETVSSSGGELRRKAVGYTGNTNVFVGLEPRDSLEGVYLLSVPIAAFFDPRLVFF